jgi:3-hydroxyisobutyrate dehydrogenase
MAAATPMAPGPVGRAGPGTARTGTVGVIGLGVMGEPIARNLMNCGFRLLLFNRSAGKAEPFRDRATLAASAREVFQDSEVILLVVPGASEIDLVLERADGVVRATVCDKIVVNLATVAPGYSESLAAAVAAQGGSYVEAPLSGSRKPAEAGTLVVLAAAADGGVLDRVQPLFDAIGRRTIRCGAPPDAMRMKLANNLLLITLLAGFAEAFHFARAMGVDLERFVEVVLAGPMANDIFRGKAGKLLDFDFAGEAAIRNVHKDIRLITAEAGRTGASAPVAATLAEVLAVAAENGLAEDDIIGIIQILEWTSAGRPA